MKGVKAANKFRRGQDKLVPIVHAMGTWVIAGISIWAIWGADFGERTAALLSTEIVDQKEKVASLKKKIEQQEHLLRSKESSLANFDQEIALLKQEVQGYKKQKFQLQEEIEQFEQRAVRELSSRWADDAGQWMMGHKVRAEVASKLEDHIVWMEKFRNWDGGSEFTEAPPYIWHLGMINENSRGDWSIRRLEIGNCGQGEENGKNLTDNLLKHESHVQAWFKCGQEFEKKFMDAIYTYKLQGIHTVRDLRRELRNAYMDESQNERVIKLFEKRIDKVFEEHGVMDDMLLRVTVRRGAKTTEIVSLGEKVLDNYRVFESVLAIFEEWN
ncbi:MAG: hypothetical protein OXC42_03770 [Gammaproteobacteria bacterium]|nr:hypothetical protein [Gammaproteobacteria bacterium]